MWLKPIHSNSYSVRQLNRLCVMKFLTNPGIYAREK